MFKNSVSLRLATVAACFVLPLSFPAFSAVPGKVQTSILFTCNLSFSASGNSVYVGVGYTSLKGEGFLNCYDLVKDTVEKIPIDVTIKGLGVGLGVTGVNISGASRGLGINKSPDTLLGNYVTVRGNAAVITGASAGVNLRVSKGSLNFGVSMSGLSGLGAGVDILGMTLSRKKAPKKVKPQPTQIVSVKPRPVQSRVLQVQNGQLIDVMGANGRLIRRLQIKVQ